MADKGVLFMPERSRIKLEILRLDFQSAKCLIEETVREKMQQIADGQSLEPIAVRYDGESYFVEDGFHRVEAARRAGLTEIDAEISAGTLAEMEAEWIRMMEVQKAELSAWAEKYGSGIKSALNSVDIP
jgi:hypothetical protein